MHGSLGCTICLEDHLCRWGFREQSQDRRGGHDRRSGRKVVLCTDEIVELPIRIDDAILHSLIHSAVPAGHDRCSGTKRLPARAESTP